jgi:hypothetical protein
MADTQTYRAARSAYVVFGIICGVPAMLLVLAALRSPMPWEPVLIPVGAYVVTSVWLSRYRLAFLPDGLSYKSPFFLDRVIPYRRIESIEPVVLAGRFPPQRVLVRSDSGEELRINIKIFSREAVQKLLALKPARPTRSL